MGSGINITLGQSQADIDVSYSSKDTLSYDYTLKNHVDWENLTVEGSVASVGKERDGEELSYGYTYGGDLDNGFDGTATFYHRTYNGGGEGDDIALNENITGPITEDLGDDAAVGSGDTSGDDTTNPTTSDSSSDEDSGDGTTTPDSGTEGDGDAADDDSGADGVGPGGIPDGGTVVTMPNGEEHVYDADGNLIGALTEDGNLYWPEDWGHHGPPDSETSCLPYWMTQGHGIQPDTMNIVAKFTAAAKGGGWIFRFGKYLSGKSGQAIAPKEAELGRKLDYLFGKATGRAHNIERSADMLRQMERIGLRDTPANRQFMSKYFQDVLNDASNIVGAGRGGATIRESLLMGPNGSAMIRSIWDGNILRTFKIFGRSGTFSHAGG